MKCCTFWVLSTLSALCHCQTHTCSNSSASSSSTAKPIAFTLYHILVPTSGTISPMISGTLLLSLPSEANSKHFSCLNVSVKQHQLSFTRVIQYHCISLYSLCVCVCCTLLCLNPCWYIHCIFLLAFITLWITFSVSVYIMCVMFVQCFWLIEHWGWRFTIFHYYSHLACKAE